MNYAQLRRAYNFALFLAGGSQTDPVNGWTSPTTGYDVDSYAVDCIEAANGGEERRQYENALRDRAVRGIRTALHRAGVQPPFPADWMYGETMPDDVSARPVSQWDLPGALLVCWIREAFGEVQIDTLMLPDGTCPNCENSSDDCSCRNCRACYATYDVTGDEVCSSCEGHQDCCGCWFCNSCSESHDEGTRRCESCEYCRESCECYSCEHCDARRPDLPTCGDCNGCDDCCECGSHPRFFKGSMVVHNAKRGQFKTNPMSRTTGVEIEVASAKPDEDNRFRAIEDTIEKWTGCIVADSSLPASGFEINTAPASGDRFVRQISEICSALSKHEASVDKSCGLHVHVGARDLRYWELRRLIALYAIVEDALFDIIAPERRRSRYCTPCGKNYLRAVLDPDSTKELKRMMFGHLYGHSEGKAIKESKESKYQDCRYFALNIHSWMLRGTIEFRMHHGTLNARKITNWSLLLTSLVDHAARLTEKEIEQFPSGFEGLLKLAPTLEVREWVQERHNHFKGDK
jgi:hypothetical protein